MTHAAPTQTNKQNRGDGDAGGAPRPGAQCCGGKATARRAWADALGVFDLIPIRFDWIKGLGTLNLNLNRLVLECKKRPHRFASWCTRKWDR